MKQCVIRITMFDGMVRRTRPPRIVAAGVAFTYIFH
jgi:hypothetical protein